MLQTPSMKAGDSIGQVGAAGDGVVSQEGEHLQECGGTRWIAAREGLQEAGG